MGFLTKPRPSGTTFKKAVERTREALEEAQERADTVDDWIQIASGWQQLVSELNPREGDDG
jgi:hypothetical protein